MNDIFYKSRRSNSYDNLIIDVDKVFEQFPLKEMGKLKVEPSDYRKIEFDYCYRFPFLPLKARNYLWHILRRTNLDQEWLERFKAYWSQILKGRPLIGVMDFHFLTGLYRVKFQPSVIPKTSAARVHLEAWQRPAVIYQLLHLVRQESQINQVHIISLMQRYRKGEVISVLEFGCATAPITTSLLEFLGQAKRLRIYIADIKTLAFHYAAFKFRQHKNVLPVLLQAQNDFQLVLPQSVNVIFCLTVFEHLNKPLDTIKSLHKYLKKDGILFFDYIKGSGHGLDTTRAVAERSQVLTFVNDNFSLIHGETNNISNGGLMIARRK